MIELKRCPFCGGKAEIEHGFCGDMTSYVHCTECHASVKPVRFAGEYAADEKVAEQWNRRASNDND